MLILYSNGTISSTWVSRHRTLTSMGSTEFGIGSENHSNSVGDRTETTCSAVQAGFLANPIGGSGRAPLHPRTPLRKSRIDCFNSDSRLMLM